MTNGKNTWVWQALSGLLLVFLLGLHLFVNHFMVGGLLTYDDIVAYLANPLVFILEVLFLIAVIFHAMLGVRALVLDQGASPQQARRLDRILIGVGMALFLYGVWLFRAILT